MKKLILTLILMSGLSAFAQTDRIDSLLNDLIYSDNNPPAMPEKPVKFDFIYAGVNYSSNSFYAGREIGSDMFNISGNLYYYHASGIFIGASGIMYDQLIPAYTNTVLAAGFSKSPGKKKLFTFRTSYSRYFYNEPDSGSNYPYRNNFHVGLSFRKKWIGARLGAGLIFGEESKINLTSAVYSRLTLAKFGKYKKLYMAPEVSAFFGTETVSTSKISGRNPDVAYEYKDIFSLLNAQVYMPVGISLGNFDIEFSYAVNIPVTRDVNISYPVKTFYGFSVGYMLPMVRKN